MSSSPPETPAGRPARAWEAVAGPGVLGVFGGAGGSGSRGSLQKVPCAGGRLHPARPQGIGGLLPTPSPFPFLMDCIHSCSFTRCEGWEQVKPQTFLVDQHLGHQCLMHWYWCGEFVLGKALGIRGLMLGAGIGCWYWC